MGIGRTQFRKDRRQTLQNNTHFLQKYETYTEILLKSQRGIDLDWDGLTQTAYTKGSRIACDI